MLHNLILFPAPGPAYVADFHAIGMRMREIAPDIAVFVVHGQALQPGVDWDRPTLAVSFRHKIPPVLKRGTLRSCRYVPKTVQVARFAKCGVPVPATALFKWGLALDPAVFGRHVIIKPIDMGRMSHGVGVQLIETSRLAMLNRLDFKPDHPIHSSNMLVQRFIDTGVRPTSFRVLTLFGEPLYAMRLCLRQERPPLDAPASVLDQAIVASNAGPRDRPLINDPDVLAFARRMAAAFPGIPLLGCDIAREEGTGRLFALECNPGGNTWHFSSPLAAKMREEMGNGRAKLIRQFGAFRKAALVLAAKTRSLAS